MRQRRLCKNLERLIVIDFVLVQNAAMAVIGVLAHADVRDDVAVGIFFLDGTDALLHDAVFIPRRRAACVLVRGDTKQQHAAHASVHARLNFLAHTVG